MASNNILSIKKSIKYKGLLFSLLTIILIVLILGELVTYEILNINYNKLSSSSIVGSSISSLINTIKFNSQNFLQQSLYKALNTTIVYEATPSLRKTNFINNTAYSLESLMINGTLFNISFVNDMNNEILIDFISTTTNSAAIQNININIINNSIRVFQNSPYYINATYTAMLILNSSIGSIKYPLQVNASISLNGTIDLLTAEQGNPKIITFSNFPNASLIGNMYALNGSMNPFLFIYGTVIKEPASISCSLIPIQFHSTAYILVTSNAMNIPQNICNMGGLITNITNSTPTNIPLAPYLIYVNSFFVSNSIQNGTKVLLNGQGLDTLNIQPIKDAIDSGDYFASQYTPSYLNYGQNSRQTSQSGIFSFNLLKRLVPKINNDFINETKPLKWMDNAKQNFTFSIWVNPTDNSGIVINEHDSDVGYRDPFISIVNNKAIVSYYVGPGGIGANNEGGEACLPLGNIPLNQWTNIAMTYDVNSNGNYLTGYINGKRMNQTIAERSIGTATDFFYNIGGSSSNSNEINCNTLANYSGQLSNFQIYNTTLSGYQIAQMYDDGISSIPISHNISLWYPLNKNLTDYIGNNNGNLFKGDTIIPIKSSFNYILNYSSDPIFYSSAQQQILSSTEKGFGCNNINNCKFSLSLSNKKIVNEPGYQITKIWNTTAFTYNNLFPFVAYFPTFGPYFESESTLLKQTTVYKQNSGWDFGTSTYNGNNFFNIPLIPFPYTLNSLNNNSITSINGNQISQNYGIRAYLYLKGTYNFYSSADDRNDICFLNSKLPSLSQPPFYFIENGYCLMNETVWNNSVVLTNSIYFQPGIYFAVGGWANIAESGFSAFLAQPGITPIHYLSDAPTNETTAFNLNSTQLPDVATFTGNGFINETNPLKWMDNAKQNFTFSIWVNPTNNSGIVINEHNISEGYRDPFISIVNNKAIVSYQVGGTTQEACLSLGNIPLNQWTNIAMTYDVNITTGNYLTGYINGKRMNQTTTAERQLPLLVTGFFYVIGGGGIASITGEWNCGTLANYSGQLSNFQIYNTTLSGYQIAQMYLNNIVPQKHGVNIAKTFYQTFYPLSGGLNLSYESRTLNVNINFTTKYPDNNAQLYGIPGNSLAICTNYNMLHRTCDVEFTHFK